MSYSTWNLVVLASLLEELEAELTALVQDGLDQVVELVLQFLSGEVTPQATFQFENGLEEVLRELGRIAAEWTYNQAEPEDPQCLPDHLRFEAGEYRRLSQKTANRHVATRFGKITLFRFAYRYGQSGEKCIFPLELQLGLAGGATPALADCAARYMAEAGASQARVLERLRREHGVGWGVKKLREVTEAKAEEMESFRHACQVARVLTLLEAAYQSEGKYKPVLAVGRDGISLCRQPRGRWEVASAATVTVYDRQGKRLGTVYLAQAPEPGQGTMTAQLTRLIQDILEGWTKPLPRLGYITDAGKNETRFYRKVLRNLRDPHRRGGRLTWYRIIDYYHATEKITIIAEALFGPGREASSWARRMRKALLKPNGASRVLHSAAAMRTRRVMNKTQRGEFDKACNYIRRRTRFMDYHGYRRLHLPIGSGVTEAACKTIFTQRLKLSGMRWKQAGAQAVLSLRVLLLSGIWDQVRDAWLEANHPQTSIPYRDVEQKPLKIAA